MQGSINVSRDYTKCHDSNDGDCPGTNTCEGYIRDNCAPAHTGGKDVDGGLRVADNAVEVPKMNNLN